MSDETTFQVSFTLKRDNRFKADDETWFDTEHIEGEIKSWLEDLDYKVEDVKIDPAKDYSEDLRNLFIAMKEMGMWGQVGLPHDWEEASALEYIKECREKGIDPILALEDTRLSEEDLGDNPLLMRCFSISGEFEEAFDHLDSYLDAISDGRSAEDFDDDDDDDSWRMGAEANDAWKVLKEYIQGGDDSEIQGDDDPEDLVIKWSVDDVLIACPWLSRDQAKEVIGLARRKHNPDVGISWYVLEEFADYLYPDRNGGDE